MEVEHKCENCYHEQDERNKIVDILDMDLEEAKKVLVETLKSTDKEQLYKDLVSSCLLVEKEQ